MDASTTTAGGDAAYDRWEAAVSAAIETEVGCALIDLPDIPEADPRALFDAGYGPGESATLIVGAHVYGTV